MQDTLVTMFPMLPDGKGPFGGFYGTPRGLEALAVSGLKGLPLSQVLEPTRRALAEARAQGRTVCGIPRVHGSGSPQCEEGNIS